MTHFNIRTAEFKSFPNQSKNSMKPETIDEKHFTWGCNVSAKEN